MMEVKPAASTEITGIIKERNSLLLRSERGIMRISPLTEESVRISYTEREFTDGQGPFLKDLIFTDWSYKYDKESIRLSLPNSIITISRKNGSVIGKSEKILFKTDVNSPFVIEAFDVYKTSEKSEIRTEQVKTADGVKTRIMGRKTEYDETLYRTRVNFAFAEKEHIIGLGQNEDGLYDLRRTTQFLHQANRKIAIPFFISSKGYGFFCTTESPAVFSDTGRGSYLRTEADEYLDFVLILGGNPKNIIHEYRLLTGKAAMLPKWAFGYVQSVERYETEKEILDTAAEFEKRRIPLDTIVLDWMSWPDGLWGQKSFDTVRFPDPKGMTDTLHKGNVHLMMSVWPNMTAASDNYKEMKANGCLLPGTEIYDAFSEKARSLYYKQLSELQKYGVDAWWCDSSEPCTPEWSRQAEPAPDDMYHEYIDECAKCMPLKKANAYGRYHAEGMNKGIRTNSDKRVVNLTRNGYMGSQQFGTILWSGDISASWDTFKRQIAAGLQFVTTGQPYWTLDIGAFFVKHGAAWYWNGSYPDGIKDSKYRELYVRWFEYGAFLPIFRAHGTDVRREPWAFEMEDDPSFNAIKKTIELRYRLLPYIYSIAGSCYVNDESMMKMLCFEFPEDEKVWEAKEQFMFGPSIMVCPITSPGDKGTFTDATREVYFPEGTDWYEFETGEKYEGGKSIKVSAPFYRIPVFVKAGAIIPLQKPMLHTKDQRGKDIELLIYPGADGTFFLYEDADEGYGYEKGEYSITFISHKEGSREFETETIGNTEFRKGNFVPVYL